MIMRIFDKFVRGIRFRVILKKSLQQTGPPGSVQKL